MTLSELLDALAARGSTLAADGDRLRQRGPRFAEGDPVRRALATFHDEVLWLLTSGRLCCFCPRLLDEADPIACAEHRRQLDMLDGLPVARPEDLCSWARPGVNEAAP